MTLNDLLRQAQTIVGQLSGGDVSICKFYPSGKIMTNPLNDIMMK